MERGNKNEATQENTIGTSLYYWDAHNHHHNRCAFQLVGTGYILDAPERGNDV